MNAIPAKVAGVGEIIMVVPTLRGERKPLVLAAARRRADRVHHRRRAGRGALAYGTATVPAVDKITGPATPTWPAPSAGVWQVGIDMIAGPSEILVLADGGTPPDWAAMDPSARPSTTSWRRASCCVPARPMCRPSRRHRPPVAQEMPRAGRDPRPLDRQRRADRHARSMEEAREISNRIAPEHLEVSWREPGRWEPPLRHAGAIFLGRHTSESPGRLLRRPQPRAAHLGIGTLRRRWARHDFQSAPA